MTLTQIRFATSHAGDLTVKEIAKKLKTSPSNVKRGCRGVRFYSKNGKYKYRPSLVCQVLDYYFEHGKPATVEMFPQVNVKCIVDRPEYYGVKRIYRQTKWTESQHLEAIRMAGVVPYVAQAKYFNRPNASAGSIKSFWVKRMPRADSSLHGMAEWNAELIVSKRCPRTVVPFVAPRDPKTKGSKALVLWVDAEKHLRPGTPEFICTAVKTMADFTRWLFACKNPKLKILKMIRERTCLNVI